MIRTFVMAAAIAVAALGPAPADAGKKSPKPPVAAKELESQDRLDNFEIQDLSSTAANLRSQAEKRLEQMRKDLTRNWGG